MFCLLDTHYPGGLVDDGLEVGVIGRLLPTCSCCLQGSPEERDGLLGDDTGRLSAKDPPPQ